MTGQRGSPRQRTMARGRDERGGLYSGYGGYRNTSPPSITTFQPRDARRQYIKESDDIRLSLGPRGAVGGDSEDSGSDDEIFFCAGRPEKRCGQILKDEDDFIKCEMCLNRYHLQCQSVSKVLFSAFSGKDGSPFICKQCNGFKGRLNKLYRGQEIYLKLEESISNISNRVSKTETDIIFHESKIKAVEHQLKFDENLEFQEAVQKQIEKHIEAIRKELKEMENKIEEVSNDIKSDGRSYQSRKNRIVIFGMPNTKNDHETVQLLLGEIGLIEMGIKKIFRINSDTGDDSIAPPLNIEFLSVDDKWKILKNDTRNKIKMLPESSQFRGISIAPDKSYRERQKYRLLREEMNQRNAELLNNGNDKEKWIIRRMSLEKLVVEQKKE